MNTNSLADVLELICDAINQFQKKQSPLLIAIDGRCASGKTTLAQALSERLHCNMIHMDDFFLQPHQRTKKRLSEAGGNVDIERFESEVMSSLVENKPFSYQIYDCQLQQLKGKKDAIPNDICIIEGSYSMHPRLRDKYDLTIFMDVDQKEQINRIRKRNGEIKLQDFIKKWIPMEEAYFTTYAVSRTCTFVIRLGQLKSQEKENKKMEKAKVFFTKEITPQAMVRMYEALHVELKGKVAVKVHSGEVGNQNFLRPTFMKDIIEHVNGTIVECNTAYEGKRNTTKEHWETMKLHGWTNVADVDILDEESDDVLEVRGGNIIDKNYVGSHMKNYDSMLVLSHFKGHPMGGFGGALKNISIGLASSFGKAYIHGAGDPEKIWSSDHDQFLESMADASKSIVEAYNGKIAFINVMKNMSVDCDCCATAEDPKVNDIGILASLDPVALDQACLDMLYNGDDPNKGHLIERIESRNGVHTVEAAAKIGVGSREYELVELKTIQF